MDEFDDVQIGGMTECWSCGETYPSEFAQCQICGKPPKDQYIGSTQEKFDRKNKYIHKLRTIIFILIGGLDKIEELTDNDSIIKMVEKLKNKSISKDRNLDNINLPDEIKNAFPEEEDMNAVEYWESKANRENI